MAHRKRAWHSKKIAIRGDGKSPDQKVIDMQLQAANLVYIFDVIILSVTSGSCLDLIYMYTKYHQNISNDMSH